MSRPCRPLLFALTVLSILAGCGGGDDDDNGDFVGAAEIKVSVSPGRVDTGDRARVSIAIEEVHKDGIILKVLHPAALHYVVDSAVLQVLNAKSAVEPAVNEPADTTVDSGVFLVFFLPRQAFKTNPGLLSFELEATRALQAGEIGVDADVNDPLVDDAQEFDIRNPEYAAEASARITVTS